MKKELGLAEAMDAAYTYLTHRERTSREVEVRLKDKLTEEDKKEG